VSPYPLHNANLHGLTIYHFLSVPYDYHYHIHDYLPRKHRDSWTELPGARDWYHLRVAGEFEVDGYDIRLFEEQARWSGGARIPSS
jgi:hypothetical protein